MLVRLSEIPAYLQDGDLFKSFDDSKDDEIEVAEDALKPDLQCSTSEDVNRAFASIRFWLVEHIPYELIDFLLSRKDVVVDDKFVIQYPDISLLRTMQASKKILKEEEKFKLAISSGSEHVMRYILARGFLCKNPTSYCVVAARAGKRSMVEYFHQQGAKLHTITCKAAFISGDMPCLEYLKEHNVMDSVRGLHLCMQGSFYPDPDAVFVKDLSTLKYAVEQGCVMNERLPYTAVELGQLEILTYVHEQGCAWDNTNVIRAAEYGQLPCVQYAVEHGCALNGQAQSKAAEKGHLHCMVYLHSVGCPWGEDTFFYAAAYNQLECLKFAHEHGAPVVKGVYRIARLKKLTAIVAYLEEHGITVEDVNNEFPPS